MDRALPGLELAAHKLSEVDGGKIGKGRVPHKAARASPGDVSRERCTNVAARAHAIAVPFFGGRSYNSGMTPSESLPLLFGLAGLLNPFALLIGAALGWYADARAKLVIAGFAAAALSVLIDVSLAASGVPALGGYEGGPLAVMPFRFLGALVIAALVHAIRKRSRRNRR